MGRFYSWKYILKHLAKLDFHYAGIGLYGKKGGHSRDMARLAPACAQPNNLTFNDNTVIFDREEMEISRVKSLSLTD